jgi:hypothetical protein
MPPMGALTQVRGVVRFQPDDAIFCLYLKTKNFHWHMAGSHFRDYHLLLDEQAK